MYRLELLKLAIAISVSIIAASCSESTGTNSSTEPANVVETRPMSDTIRQLETRLKRDPEDFVALNKLAAEYLQKLRETGDANYLDLALRTARKSLEVLPAEQNKGGLAVLTQAQFSSHDFQSARENAEKLIALEPGKSYSYQLLGDALLELGNYPEAETAFQKMREAGSLQGITQVASEQRLAKLKLLHGDPDGASGHFLKALKIAKAMPAPPTETIAWCQWQLGETAFATGDYRKAKEFYISALEAFPGYYRAAAGLGKVTAANGDIDGAIAQYESVVNGLPDPAFVSTLGDLYMIAGRSEDSSNQYHLVEKIGGLNQLNGTIYNRGLALFYADHNMKPEEAYALAAKEYEIRRDIYGADALAWTAFKAGRLTEARTAAREALRLGTRDARILYHAGAIEDALGNRTEARKLIREALRLNPEFDPVQAPIARRLSKELENQ